MEDGGLEFVRYLSELKLQMNTDEHGYRDIIYDVRTKETKKYSF